MYPKRFAHLLTAQIIALAVTPTLDQTIRAQVDGFNRVLEKKPLTVDGIEGVNAPLTACVYNEQAQAIYFVSGTGDSAVLVPASTELVNLFWQHALDARPMGTGSSY